MWHRLTSAKTRSFESKSTEYVTSISAFVLTFLASYKGLGINFHSILA